MTGWSEYALALALFVASHYVPRLGGLRDRLIGGMGRRAYFSVYGLVSLGLLTWLFAAAGRAPYIELWPQTAWTRWVPNIAMPVAALLIACGAGLRQPFTLGDRRGIAFDPELPGFAAVSRHPLFLALALWAGAHLAPNGDLAHVILFGSFLTMALVAIQVSDAKAVRALSPRDAHDFLAHTRVLSFTPLFDARWLRTHSIALAKRGSAGVLGWLALLHLHSLVIGVSPFPI